MLCAGTQCTVWTALTCSAPCVPARSEPPTCVLRQTAGVRQNSLADDNCSRPGVPRKDPGLPYPSQEANSDGFSHSAIPQERPGEMSGLSIGLIVAAPWVILGTIGLIKADRKDIPEVIRWLSRWGRK